ncbi:hypothetical protein DBR42_00830 [Pelomonas sp. HMWF004]|nr:hypothetical protein DBR42_00830 [Pelomonas sp. HMWF004]
MNKTKVFMKPATLALACVLTGLTAQAVADGATTLPGGEACVPKVCPASKPAKPAQHRVARPSSSRVSAAAPATPSAAASAAATAAIAQAAATAAASAASAVADRKQPDATAADSSLALRDTPTKEIDLPGVLRVDGESVMAFDPTKSHKITWANEGIQPIPISLTGPDHLILPFNDPYITGNDWVNIDKRAVSNNVYITFAFPDGVKPQPVTIYIESPTGGPSLGLQLMPKDIAPQTYTVIDEISLNANSAGRNSSAADYESRILDLMATVALRGTPSGYSVLPLKLPPVAFHGLRLDTVRRLSNIENDIFEYEISNPTQKPVTVAEKDFSGARVQAVSIFPKSTLRPNERARVYVIANKAEAK